MALNDFYIAKVNVNQNIFNEEEEVNEIISKRIPEQILEFTKGYKGDYITEKANDGSEIRWSLAETTLINKNVISGNLTKSVPLRYDSIDDENKIVEKSPEDEFETESAFFIYFIDIEKLCFKTNQQINKNIFLRKFKELLEFKNGFYIIGELEIFLITESEKIKHLLLTKKVTDIKIEVIQPNGRKRQYKRMQTIIKSTKSKKTNIKLQNNDGLQVRADDSEELNDILSEGIKMTEDGYGTMSLAYYEGKKKKHSSTSHSPLKIGVTMNEDRTNVLESDIIDLQTILKKREQEKG